MKYKDFIINYKEPFWHLETLYSNLGILTLIDKVKLSYGITTKIKHYKMLSCNSATRDKIRIQLIYNWKNFNYNRDTGLHRGVKTVKRKTVHPLSTAEQQRVMTHVYFDYSPVIDDNLPDNVIRCSMD